MAPESSKVKRVSDEIGRVFMFGYRSPHGNTSLEEAKAVAGPFAHQLCLLDSASADTDSEQLHGMVTQLAAAEYLAFVGAGGPLFADALVAGVQLAERSAYASAAFMPGTPFTFKSLSVAPDFENQLHDDVGDYQGRALSTVEGHSGVLMAGCIAWYRHGNGVLEGGEFVQKHTLQGRMREVSFQPVDGTVLVFDTKGVKHHTRGVRQVSGQAVQLGTALGAKPGAVTGCANAYRRGQIDSFEAKQERSAALRVAVEELEAAQKELEAAKQRIQALEQQLQSQLH